MSTFVPRTTAPSSSDPNWIRYTYGGRNRCIISDTAYTYGYSAGSVLPNCVGYAWGRFMEILGEEPKLSTGNAGLWYSYTADGYQRGTEPQLGAVACWSKPGDYGHVAIVEQINSDGSIVTSNSGWGWKSPRGPVEMIRGTYPRWTTWSGYQFQGFIYNPGCDGLTDKLSEFLAEAESHVGEHGDWTWAVSGLGRGQPWCAAFVMAVAKTVGGILGTILPSTYSSSDFARRGVSEYGGTWLPGPAQGQTPTPQIGDLILFRNNDPFTYVGKDTYTSDHIGIVKQVVGNVVHTIEGNTGTWDNNTSYVKLKQYNITAGSINGYFRPAWSKVGASVLNQITASLGPLYDVQNTRKDALIREVGYISPQNTITSSTSNILVSAMNYTFLLNSLYEMGSSLLQPQTVPGDTSTVVVDNLDNNAESVVRFMMAQGLNAAAGVGIAANIYHESSFRTNAEGDYQNGVPTSFGLCGWHLGRGDRMKQMAGPNWATNMSGQLQYLWYELTTSYTTVLSFLKSVPNNESGARAAANNFVRQFERPANVDYQSQIRQNTASQMWNQLIPVLLS